MKTFDYAGKTWRYDKKTIFIIETGRYHNSYKFHTRFPHDMLQEAIQTYEEMNISDHYKKRLVMAKDDTRTKITHQTSKGVRK